MSLDPRSQALSLVGVFLALGVGILIGASMLGHDFLADHQQNMIQELERSFAELRLLAVEQSGEIERLSDALRAQEGFGQAVMEVLVVGALEGKRAIVVEIGGTAPEGAVRALELAGASIVATVSMADNDLIHDPTSLGGALAEPTSPWALRYLSGIANQGDTFMRGPFLPPEVAVIWVSQEVEHLSEIDALAGGLESSGVRTAVVSPYGMGSKLGRLKRVSTVDCGDMALGQVAMVFLLEGAEGHYGLGRHTLGPLPERGGVP